MNTLQSVALDEGVGSDPFDRLAPGYDLANALSFGIADLARRRAVAMLPRAPLRRIAVFMSGTGLDVRPILQHFPEVERVTCYDASRAMNRIALGKWGMDVRVHVCFADVLREVLPAESHDAVVVNFGWKTLDADELRRLANAVAHVLVPGGSFCGCDFGLSDARWMNALVRAHTSRVIPAIVCAIGGDAPAHALLWQHLSRFDDECLSDALSRCFNLRTDRLLGGLVRSFAGRKL